MKKLGIAELKSRLSDHLRAVRRRQSRVVFDRDTPIARIVPYEASPGPLAVRGPRPGAPKPGRVPLPPPLRLDVDVVEFLLEERQGER